MPVETQSPERRISRGVVGIYKDYTGRGPTTARTSISEMCVMTVLHDSLTKAETRLVAKGDVEVVRGVRRRFQEVMGDDIRALVEEVTERKTGTFLSDHNPDDDVAVEVVMFADSATALDTPGPRST